jgi:hypothetical protein
MLHATITTFAGISSQLCELADDPAIDYEQIVIVSIRVRLAKEFLL